MTTNRLDEHVSEALQYLQRGRSFLLYLLPGASTCDFHPYEEGAGKYTDAVVEPFASGDESFPGVSVPPHTSKEEYLRGFASLKKAMETGELTKAILSRVIHVPKPSDFQPTEYFNKLCRAYPHAFVYLAHHPRYGLWVGATPEVLLRKSGDFWHTVSLAGTRRFSESGRYDWTEKERVEQELVSVHIRHVLKKHGAIDVRESGPITAEAGSVAHLKTDFWFRLEDEERSAPAVLKDLHPTPAVGGVPLENAVHHIALAESRDRQLYTGYLGRFSPPRYADVYVNLRCMKIGSDALALFSGGGITAGSEAESEWKETADKAETLSGHLTEDPI